ncbi:MAG: hypothetical protein C4346_14205, partial [Chloroflexota bacterium]
MGRGGLSCAGLRGAPRMQSPVPNISSCPASGSRTLISDRFPEERRDGASPMILQRFHLRFHRWARLAGTAILLGLLLVAGFPVTTGRATAATLVEAHQRPPHGDPADHASRVWRDVTYCTMDGVALPMDVYAPRDATGATPAVVYVHGGAWVFGDKSEGTGAIMMPALLDAGFTVVAVNYRLAPAFTFPAMIEDVKCAIRSLRAHAAMYGIDPDRIGAWGESA